MPDAGSDSTTLLVARPERETLLLTGYDRLDWLNGVVSCDCRGLRPGDGRWGLVLTKQGKVLSDVDVVAAEDAVFLGLAAGRAEVVLDWLDGFLIMEDAELESATDEYRWLSLHGPEAGRIASAAGAGVARAAIDWTGLGGAALVVRATEVEQAIDRLASAGAVPAAPGQWERLRLERLVPVFGVDYDERQNAHGASLDRRAVSWDKGCYLGQEAVCMLDMRGKVKRRLVTFAVDLSGDVGPGADVTDAESGERVGEVTSTAKRDGGLLVMARVKSAYAEPSRGVRIAGAPGALVAHP